jgi:hypothetical protein
MTVVFPLLLGGLAAVSVPVLIHLIMRQKPKTLKFPAFRFLLQRHRTNLRKLRLRHLLLLVLRMLLLVLICLALARLKLFRNPWSLNTDRPVAAILVFDTSYSMEYRITGGQNRLEEAKKRGLELLDQLPEGSMVAILDTAEAAATGKGAWEKSLAEARQRVKGLRLRHANSPVTARLQDAYRIFHDLALGRDDFQARRLPRFLCVFSDGMAACWDGASISGLLKEQDTVPPPLEKLQLLQNSISTRLELLQGLRQALPPPAGKDYAEQTLIDLWQKLQKQTPGAFPEDYPDKDLQKLLFQLRGEIRQLHQQIRSQSPDALSPQAKAFRQTMLDSLADSLEQLHGVFPVFFDVGVERPTDLAIVRLEFPGEEAGSAAAQYVFAPGDKFLLRATVQATGQDFEATVRCEVGGKKLAEDRLVKLKAGGKQVVSFEIDCKQLAPGPQSVRVWLSRPDLLDFTNRRFATFQIRQPRQILIVTDVPDGARVWKKAVEYTPKASFRCTVLTAPRAEGLGPKGLAGYETVYLLNVVRPPKGLWDALTTYVDQGGSLCVIPGGKDMDLDAYNKNASAQQLLPAQFKKVITAEAAAKARATAKKSPADTAGVEWNWEDQAIYQHPLFRVVKDWRLNDQAEFIKVPRRATQYWEVEPAGKQALVIVSYKDKAKHPAVLERNFGNAKGKVVLLTTRLDTGYEPLWNNYLKTDSYFCVILPGLLTRYLATDADRTRMNFISGQEVPRIKLPLRSTGLTFTLKGPETFETIARPEDQKELLFPKAVVPGNYVVEEQNDVIGAFSVNFPPEEAVLTRVPREEIESVLGRGAVVADDWRLDLREMLQGTWSAPEELFPWLMVVLLIFLALENLLGNLFYRREPQPQETKVG